MRFTVYFDGQFWVGVAEDTDFEPPVVARHIFGAEPQDAEIVRFVNERMLILLAEAAVVSPAGQPLLDNCSRVRSPKRRAREAGAAVREHGISTRSQLALSQHYEARKLERRTQAREEQEAELERRRVLKREKAKARHRGH
jgi:hypothetical protein